MPPDATAEERSLRAFKDAIGYHAATAIGAALSEDGEEERYSAAAVCDAYSAVLEHRPQELDPERTAITGAGVLKALRGRWWEARPRGSCPDAGCSYTSSPKLDHYFFELSEGRERVYDMPELPEEERAAEHGLRHDLLLALYEELAPAFDVSLSWPPNGYEVGERGEIIDLKDPGRTSGSAGVGYDHVYDLEVFYEGNAGEEGYGEGRLERITYDEPGEEGS